jgi:putative endonuclease
MPKARHAEYFVYIVECVDGTYYTGYTENITRRVEQHNKKRGAKYLRGKLPVKLIYFQKYRYYKNALLEERRIKTLSRKKKEALLIDRKKNEIIKPHRNQKKSLQRIKKHAKQYPRN